jgi:hypothetical protein
VVSGDLQLARKFIKGLRLASMVLLKPHLADLYARYLQIKLEMIWG